MLWTHQGDSACGPNGFFSHYIILIYIVSHYQSPWHKSFWLPWNIDYGQCGLDSEDLQSSIRTSMVHTCGNPEELASLKI